MKIGNIAGMSAVIIAAVFFGITVATDIEPTTVSIYEDGKALQVATPSNYYLPDGAIIHENYGKGWQCVEFNGHFLLMRQAGTASLAVKVDSCNTE